MAFEATHRFVRMSAKKIRPVAALIREKSAVEALDILKFMPNRGARFLEAVLKSAMANAQDLAAVDRDDLKVQEVRVDEGPRMKRIQPHARGMAFGIMKRFSHIKITVDKA